MDHKLSDYEALLIRLENGAAPELEAILRKAIAGDTVPDLEGLIRAKQDQLRGRPEDWIDRTKRWHPAMFGVAGLLIGAALFGFGMWIGE